MREYKSVACVSLYGCDCECVVEFGVVNMYECMCECEHVSVNRHAFEGVCLTMCLRVCVKICV